MDVMSLYFKEVIKKILKQTITGSKVIDRLFEPLAVRHTKMNKILSSKKDQVSLESSNLLLANRRESSSTFHKYFRPVIVHHTSMVTSIIEFFYKSLFHAKSWQDPASIDREKQK